MTQVTTRPEARASKEPVTLRVTEVRDEAEGIRSFELREPQGHDLAPFEAGAHLPIEVELPDSRTALRYYSLLGDQRDRRRYRIAVLLEPMSRGGSRLMHEHVSQGSTLRAHAPENGFPLIGADHSILIAGGIGITPILSMVRTLEQQGRSYELHYAARTPARMAFREEVGAFRGGQTHLYFTHVDRPDTIDLEGLFATAKSEASVYVCGPPGLIRAVTSMGDHVGWPMNRIHVESFGPTQHDGDRSIDVYLARSALTVQVAAGDTILDAILRAGVWAPYECRRGNCATCMTQVISGEPDHRDVCLTEALRETYMCTCVSRARSGHLTLDL